MANRPNPYQTWEEFGALVKYWADRYGRAYVWELKNHFGEFQECYCLDPMRIIAEAPRQGYPSGSYRLRSEMLPGDVTVGGEHVTIHHGPLRPFQVNKHG